MTACPVCGRPKPTTTPRRDARRITCGSRACAATITRQTQRARDSEVDVMAVDRLVHGETVHSTRAERSQASAILTAAGHSAAHIAVLLRIAERSVVRYRRVVNA